MKKPPISAPKRTTARSSSSAPLVPREADTAPKSQLAPGAARDARGESIDAQACSRLQARLQVYLQRGRARVVVTDNLRTMVSIKRGRGVLTFRIHHMFVDSPTVVVRALTRYATAHDAEAARTLRTFIDERDHLIRRPDTTRAVPMDTRGRFHDLCSIFDRLNRDYFTGTIRARITWGPRARRPRGRGSIKLGSYTYEDQLIRIHPVLDAADVPRFFVEWIVYHEMLHEIHDMPIIDGRRVYHTVEFREAEARFEQYAESVLWERVNLYRLLDR